MCDVFTSGFILPQSILVGKSRQWETEAAGHRAPTGVKRRTGADRLQDPIRGMVPVQSIDYQDNSE